MFSIHIFLYSRFFSLVCPKITNIHDFRLFHFLYNHDYFVLFRKVVLFYISSICVSKVFLLYLYVLCPSLFHDGSESPLFNSILISISSFIRMFSNFFKEAKKYTAKALESASSAMEEVLLFRILFD